MTIRTRALRHTASCHLPPSRLLALFALAAAPAFSFSESAGAAPRGKAPAKKAPVKAAPVKAAPAKKAPARGAAARGVAAKATSPANIALVSMTEPVEKSYTAGMPKGWRNQLYLARLYNMHRIVLTSLSPDGQTLLFSGDPRLPSYTYPSPYTQGFEALQHLNPLLQVSDYVPPSQYFPRYVREKFGRLPGFRIVRTTPNPEAIASLRKVMQRSGLHARPEAVRVFFTYTEKGKPMNALINGYTMSNEQLWVVDVSGITTPGNPLSYNNLLMRVIDSGRTNPQWKAREQQLHEQRMAQMRMDHQNQLASWNASNQRHQMRMQSIQDQGNANMRQWYQNQVKSDANHRNFLNYITEEKTVVDSSGRAYQVDNSHQRYYINKHDQTFIGTDSHTSLNDLRSMGIDPSGYEEARIKR